MTVPGFEKDYTGLSAEEYEDNLDLFGLNTALPHTAPTLQSRILRHLLHPAFLLLCAGAALLVLLRQWQSGLTLLASAALLFGLSFYFDRRADRDAKALYKLSQPAARAIRGGALCEVPASELAPGDIIALREGERIPADAVVLEAAGFTVDERALPGDGAVSVRQENDVLHIDTIALSGRCVARVIATGIRTAAYKEGKLPASAADRPGNIERAGMHITRVGAILGALLLIPAFVVTYQRGANSGESVLSALALALSMIPTGLILPPAVLLAAGALRLAKSGAIPRRVSSPYTLGCASAFCVDVNGFPAQEQMEVGAHFTASEETLSHIACLASGKAEGEPLEAAVLAFCERRGADVSLLQSNLLIHEYPRARGGLFTAKIWRIGDAALLCVKGLPEKILPLCELTPEQRYAVRAKQSEFERQGLRVLTVATAQIEDAIPMQVSDCRLTYVGLIGISAPPPQSAATAIASCARAGIRMVLITSDNPETAMAMGKAIGIDTAGGVITGRMLDNAEESAFTELGGGADIFASVETSHRPLIVKALQAAGERVAVIGTGLSDIAVMNRADIAMAPIDYAGALRDNAQILLPNERLITAASAISQARHICDTALGVAVNTVVLHIPLILLALLHTLTGYPIAATPAGIILLEIIAAGASLLLPPAQADKGTMLAKAPYRRGKLSRAIAVKPALQAGVLSACTLSGYLLLHRQNPTEAAGFAFMALMAAALVLGLVTGTRSGIFAAGWRSTRRYIALGSGAALLAAYALLAPVQSILGIPAPSGAWALAAVGTGLASVLWWELARHAERIVKRLAAFFSVLFRGKS